MDCFSYSSGVQRSKMDSTGLKSRCSFWRLLGRICFLVYSSIYRLPSFLGLWPPSSNHVTPSAASVIPHSSDSHPSAPVFKNPWDYIQSNRSWAQSCLTLGDPMDCNPPGSSVHGIFQSRYWSDLPFPSPGNLPDPRIEPESPASPALQAGSLPAEPALGPPKYSRKISLIGFLTGYGFQATIID